MFAICDQVQPLLSPRYMAVLAPYIAYEAIAIASTRVIVPDVGVLDRDELGSGREAVAIAPAPLTGLLAVPTRYHRIELRTISDEQLVTVIEVLSPANKCPGQDGADAYERKRRDILMSSVHLLELDLLRGGRRPLLVTPLPDAPYFITLSRVERRPEVEIWPLALDEPLPVVPVPLQAGEADVPLDLAGALAYIYRSARYDLRINYRMAPPPPALPPATAAWLEQHLRGTGVR